MIIKEDFYYCKNCKKVLDNLDDLLFVEEGSPSCFCSEACIEQFYSPLVDYFQGKIYKMRKDLKLEDEPAQELIEDAVLVEKVLSRPDQVWHLENQLKEEIYTFILEHTVDGETTYLIALCFVFNKTPSFVFALTATKDDFFLQQFQLGEQIDSLEEYYKEQMSAEHMIDPDTIEMIEQKKSKVLAELMQKRSEADIPFESFDLYMDYLGKTLEESDEIYRSIDDESDSYQTYIKAFEKEGVSFFYIVICFVFNSSGEEDLVLPVLSFPTIDGELCKSYREGEQVSGGLKN